MSSSDTRGTARTVESYDEHPTPDGGKAGTRTATTTTEEHQDKTSGVDQQALADTIGAVVRGAMNGGGFPWGSVAGITGALGTAAVGYAISKRNEANLHRADADQAWNRVLDQHEKDKE